MLELFSDTDAVNLTRRDQTAVIFKDVNIIQLTHARNNFRTTSDGASPIP